VSALLLQLVQTSAHDVRVQAQRFFRKKTQAAALRRQESGITIINSDQELLEKEDHEVKPILATPYVKEVTNHIPILGTCASQRWVTRSYRYCAQHRGLSYTTRGAD
jgi:hypothetical protein